MKKFFASALTLCFLVLLVFPAMAATVTLNQRMATRSGPGTQYTEELGTLPQDTAITLIHYVQDKNQVPWGLVEFYRHNQLYRAYTGMKRIDVLSGSATYVAEYGTYASTTAATTVYYGPGTHYAARRQQLPAYKDLLVYQEENGFLLCEYQEGARVARGYVPAHATNYAVAPSLPAPQPGPSSTGGITLTAQSGDSTLNLQWLAVGGATEYLLVVRDAGSQLPIRALRTASPNATVQNLPRGRAYTVEILALGGADGSAVLAGTTLYHQVP